VVKDLPLPEGSLFTFGRSDLKPERNSATLNALVPRDETMAQLLVLVFQYVRLLHHASTEWARAFWTLGWKPPTDRLSKPRAMQRELSNLREEIQRGDVEDQDALKRFLDCLGKDEDFRARIEDLHIDGVLEGREDLEAAGDDPTMGPFEPTDVQVLAIDEAVEHLCGIMRQSKPGDEQLLGDLARIATSIGTDRSSGKGALGSLCEAAQRWVERDIDRISKEESGGAFVEVDGSHERLPKRLQWLFGVLRGSPLEETEDPVYGDLKKKEPYDLMIGSQRARRLAGLSDGADPTSQTSRKKMGMYLEMLESLDLLRSQSDGTWWVSRDRPNFDYVGDPADAPLDATPEIPSILEPPFLTRNASIWLGTALGYAPSGATSALKDFPARALFHLDTARGQAFMEDMVAGRLPGWLRELCRTYAREELEWTDESRWPELLKGKGA
jgi:hypothetical protein